ncbi:hypothetical protein IE53DRAFT_388282 [Violaceomyces palustris]|uniref:Uncharacterized protein n=1 Tax=Violaceomyces palustris TaxID=1673888 RepID=A0ACD0NUH1_9BASI|nr:hypothetical protein IE53DRAFT_388282 [Violaceomyces palustris]
MRSSSSLLKVLLALTTLSAWSWNSNTVESKAIRPLRTNYVLNEARFSIASLDGSPRSTRNLQPSPPPPSSTDSELEDPIRLEIDDVLKLSFNLGLSSSHTEDLNQKPGLGGKENVPHQSFVTLSQVQPVGSQDFFHGQSHAWPVVVKPATGRVLWSLRMDRLPTSLQNVTSPLKLSLLLATFPTSSSEPEIQPLHYPIANLLLPPYPSSSLPISNRERNEQEQGFKRWKEHKHTFGIPPYDTMPKKQISGIASVITVLVPWILLLTLISSLKLKTTSPTTKISSLLICILGLELLAVRYWIGMTLFKMLPYLVTGGILTIVLGKGAMSDLRRRRRVASSP